MKQVLFASRISKKFENTYIVENEVGALGRGIYYWGGTYSNVVDGNELCDNGGILMEDLSGCGDTWQSAGELFGQILNNRVYRGRAFYSNSSTIGVLRRNYARHLGLGHHSWQCCGGRYDLCGAASP